MTDVWYATWDFTVNRSDSESTVRSAFQGQGYDDVFNIENGTADETGGWLYTVDSIPGYEGDFPEGATRVLCVETNPRELAPGIWQSDPSLQFWPETSPAGTIPADVWIQWWQYNCRSGDQQSTFDVRDKTLYVTQSDPPYPSTDFPWLALQGSGGFNHNPPPNYVDNFLALQAQRSEVPYDSGSDPIGYQKMFQNLSEAVITPNAWFQVKMHIDTSGAQGSWEAWIRERGTPTWTKVAEWLPGVTTHDPGTGEDTFQWPTSAEDRAGAKVMRWPSTTNGEDRHAFRYFGPLAIATSEALLPDDDSGGDSGGGGEESDWTANDLAYLPIIPGSAGFGTNQYGGSGRHLGEANEAAIFFVDDRGTGETGSWDSGTRIGYGTTKWCANHPEYGHVVWLVNGVIDYTGGGSRNIPVENSYKTFHGHTAPGEIHYRGGMWVTNGSHLCFWHLPIWQDLYEDGESADCTNISGILPSPELVLWANCFKAYGADENVDWFRQIGNGGLWQCVVAWALTNGNHPEGEHNYGVILGEDCENISLGRTIISHCRARFPLSYAPSLSIFNCLMHNWTDNATQIAGDSVATDTNIESTLYVWGPDTSVNNAIRLYNTLLPGSRVYLNNNRGVGLDDEDLLQNDAGLTLEGSRIASIFPTGAGVTPIVDRQTFAQLVIDHAGPRPTSRNSRIQTIMDEIINAIDGSGSLGGYPATPSTYGYPSVTPGSVLDPSDPGSFWGGVPCPMNLATRNQVMPSGYTRFEEWSHGVADQFMPTGWSSGGGEDTTPNAFSFTDQTGVARSSTRTSASITVSGIDAPAAISVSGGQYSVNGGSFTSSPSTVNNGDTVRARHTSSASYSTATNTVVTIGGVSDTFTSTTESEIIIPAYRWHRVSR